MYCGAAVVAHAQPKWLGLAASESPQGMLQLRMLLALRTLAAASWLGQLCACLLLFRGAAGAGRLCCCCCCRRVDRAAGWQRGYYCCCSLLAAARLEGVTICLLCASSHSPPRKRRSTRCVHLVGNQSGGVKGGGRVAGNQCGRVEQGEVDAILGPADRTRPHTAATHGPPAICCTRN